MSLNKRFFDNSVDPGSERPSTNRLWLKWLANLGAQLEDIVTAINALITEDALDIPLTKLADQAAHTIVGNKTAGSAAPTALSIADVKTELGVDAASGIPSLTAGSLVTQNPANATATPAASKIPIAAASGQPLLAKGWLPPIAMFTDIKATNTAGGTSTSATWHTRTLNTTIVNDISGVSLSSNRITIPAGTYEVLAFAPCASGDRHALGIYDYTGGAFLGYDGGIEYVSSALYAQTTASINTVITVSGTVEIELRHYITTGVATVGLGYSLGATGRNEVYAIIKLTKIA